MSKPQIEISIVIPVYNTEKKLPELIYRLKKTVKQLNQFFEIILIDDKSKDKTIDVIEKLKKDSPEIITVFYEKNKGQHVAILRGLQEAIGNWVVVMDCDLQDLPEEIPVLFSKANQENKIVLAVRTNKQFPYFRRLSSFILNGFLSLILAKKYHHTTGNFGVYHRDVIDIIKEIPMNKFYLPAALRNTNYHITFQNVKHGRSVNKTSSYHLISLIKLAIRATKASLFHIKTKSS